MNPTDVPSDTPDTREHRMLAALREWDPEAEMQWDAASGRLSVHTTLSAERVSTLLASLGEQVSQCGEAAEPAGQNCCGCCG